MTGSRTTGRKGIPSGNSGGVGLGLLLALLAIAGIVLAAEVTMRAGTPRPAFAAYREDDRQIWIGEVYTHAYSGVMNKVAVGVFRGGVECNAWVHKQAASMKKPIGEVTPVLDSGGPAGAPPDAVNYASENRYLRAFCYRTR